MAGEGEYAEAGPSPRRRGARWWRWLLGGLATIVLLLAAGIIALDTAPGRRFIIDRIEALQPANGMRIRIGRIDGSIYGRMTVSDLRLYDPRGLFFEAPEIELDWQPFAYLLANRLQIESAASELVILHRLPELIPSDDPDAPILPDFDIVVERFDVGRIRFRPPVFGEERRATVAGSIDIRNGRARVNIAGRAFQGGDRHSDEQFSLALDAEPDGDIFDIEARIAAPADGIVARLTGIARPLRMTVTGDGTWSQWDGEALVDDGDTRIVDLQLGARDGQYTLGGAVRTETLLEGVGARLTAPEVTVNATATFENRLLDGRFVLRSPSLALSGSGGIDFGESAFRGFAFDARLLRPEALAPDIRGRDMRFVARLDGEFGRAAFSYRLTAPQASFGATVMAGVVVEGDGRLSEPPVVLPLSARVRSITGYGPQADELLTNVAVAGAIRIEDGQIVGDDLSLRSDRLRGDFSLIYDLRRADYAVALNADLAQYYVPGLGIVDLRTNVDIAPAPGGGFRIAGRARAAMRRLDNGFLENLAGGLPVLDTAIAYGPDGQLGLSNLRITGPALSLTGSGYRRRDGTIHFSGSGTQQTYGPIELTLDGEVTRPRVDLVLASPYPAAGLADVRVSLDPSEDGYAYAATGESRAGPFSANGAIVLPEGDGPTTIRIAALDVADTHSTGQLALQSDGIAGAIDTTGPGLVARTELEPSGGVQTVTVHAEAENASIGGEIDATIRQATVDVTAMLSEGGPRIAGTIDAYGVEGQGVSIARLQGDVDMTGGVGRANLSIAGARGRGFDFQATADFAPGAVTINGGGNFEDQPITLSPVRIVSEGEGWRLEESTITYADGGATLSGRFGGEATALDARLDNVPLGVIDIFFPEIGFGGNITGTIHYDQPAGAAVPEADVEIRIRSLTREGFVLSPRPVNLGINVRQGGGVLAARAIMEGEGEELMRGQVRIDRLSGEGGLLAQLRSAPLFAELRYSGPAETVWQLAGNDMLGISGPIVARADASGTLDLPQITGLVQAEGVRIESGLTGTVVENVRATGTFAQSTLTIPEITGTTPEDGRITGSARFDLGLAQGFGMDIRIQAENALLINRDDIAGRVNGPVSIVLAPGPDDGDPDTLVPLVGRIEGDLDLVEGRFRLGQAAAAAQIPELNVVEINAPLDAPQPAPAEANWTLDIDVDARNRFTVTGLGLDSEWSADLNVSGPLAQFAILGEMNLIRGGYEFAGRRFELDEGRIVFNGQTPVNPRLDITAVAELDGVDATINIGGSSAEPEIVFTSVPALPQEELLSRMLFGSSITSLSAPEALQLAASIAALQGGGGGLNPINAVRDAIGLDRLRIVPADLAAGRGTAVAAGKYITRRLYVEVITDGQGYSATQVEFQVTRWLSLLSTISTVGRQSLNARISRDY